MRKLISMRSTCLALMFALVLACVSVFFVLMPATTARADEGQAQYVELGEIGVTYIIGDDSIIGTYGAMPVNEDSDTYGWYTYISVTNTYTYSNIEYGWITAMNTPSYANNRVKVVLSSDWTAQPTTANASDGRSIVTAFGFDSSAFYNGGLYVPDGMNLQLDLNGKVLNRAADITRSYYGSVIYGGNCSLEITDSDVMSVHEEAEDMLFAYNRTIEGEDGETTTERVEISGGIITGGACDSSDSSANGHGINMANGGQLVISAGTIANNQSKWNVFTPYGGGIYGIGSNIIITGGAVVNNSVRSGSYQGGGGIYLSGGTLDIRGGIISDNNSDCFGGGVYLNSGKLLMSGGEISYNTSLNNNPGVYAANSILLIDGGKIASNIASVGNDANGGGCLYLSSSVATMNGGEISGNTSMNGGGVYVYIDSTFTINGGEISDNTSKNNGGGVYVNSGTFTMNGGEISGNTTTSGGGVYVCNGSMFTMNGGEISGNTANSGGGVYVYNGSTFTMNSGEIGGNTANSGGGVYVNSGTFNVCDNPVIIGNKNSINATEENVADNVYGKINVIGELTEGAQIGVCYDGIVTKDYAKYNGEGGYVKDPIKVFFADKDDCGIALTADREVACIPNANFEFGTGYGLAGEEIELGAIDGIIAVHDYQSGYKAQYEITNSKSAELTLYKVLKNGVTHSGDIAQAGVYEIVYHVAGSSVDAVFAIIIKPIDVIDEDITILIDQTSFKYDGNAKTPGIIGFEYKGVELVEDTDYTLSYENNVYAGTGYVVIDFMGNYSGQKKVPFTIDIDGGFYRVAWEYYNGTEWIELRGDNLFTFIPGLFGNQSNRVRVKLESEAEGEDEQAGIVKYAYAKNVVDYLDELTADEISGYYIEYSIDESIVEFHNAGEYSLSIKNDGTEMLLLNNNAYELIGGKTLKINYYSISENDEKLEANILEECEYTGVAQQPLVSVIYDNLELEIATDFRVEYYDGEHTESAINGGTAYARIVFIGNYSGEKLLTFEIRTAENEWLSSPDIIRWTYGAFDPETAVIIATPKFILDSTTIGVSILDSKGSALTVNGVSLSDIAVKRILDDDYGWCFVITDEDVVAAINTLEVARYTLRVWLEATQSYSELSVREITFNIYRSINSWDEAPSVHGWTEGKYDEENNLPNAVAHFGNENVRIVISDIEDETVIYYDSDNGINRLYDLEAGMYYLTATVEGNDNYTELSYSGMFRVLADTGVTVINQGLPWWAVLLIVLAVVIVLAAVILVLHIKGVFQIITGKMVIAMRSRADVDATIAAVRAGRIAAAAESASTVSAASAAAQAKEQAKNEKKAKALEKKAKTPEEKAAELEAKAKAMRKRAEEMKAKAKNAELKAAAMVMTPEEKAAAKAREKEEQERKAKAKTPEVRAEMLEEKARLTEEQAENLKARAEVMKSRANEMREKAAAKAEREKEKAEKEQIEKEKAEKEKAQKEKEQKTSTKAKAKAGAKKKAKTEAVKDAKTEAAKDAETPTITDEKQAETTATIENEEE